MAAARLSWQQLKDLWTQYGGDPKYASMAAAVAMAESGGRPDARNDNRTSSGTITSTDYGLWQINSKWNGGSPAYYDPVTNVRAAIRISHNGTSWRSWCSAYSDNLCGSRGGTYLGSGSHALHYLQTNGGGSTGGAPPGGANSGGSTGGGSTSGGTTQPVGIVSDTVKQVFGWVVWLAEAGAGIFLMVMGLVLIAKWAQGGNAPSITQVFTQAVAPSGKDRSNSGSTPIPPPATSQRAAGSSGGGGKGKVIEGEFTEGAAGAEAGGGAELAALAA